MSIAIYAGSFDPITEGHLSVVRNAARLFSHVRIVVAHNPQKQGLFTTDERVELIREAVASMPTVSVDVCHGLVVEYARKIAARFLVRGIRGASDATFETQLAHANRELAPEVDTIFLPAEASLAQVSSSELKARARRGEDLTKYCPPNVERSLIARLGELR